MSVIIVKPMQGLNCNINMIWEWHMKKNTNFPRGQIKYIRGEQLLENLCLLKIALLKKPIMSTFNIRNTIFCKRRELTSKRMKA